MELNVDIISDVICPWCYIGKRRFEKAVRSIAGQHTVKARWLPFQLNPMMPEEGMDRVAYRSKKFGSWERSQEMDAQVAATGLAEGIRFGFGRMERTPNTFDAHRLIWLAGERGVQDAVVEAIFRGYFTEGLNVNDRETLTEVVGGAGLDREEVSRLLSGDEGADAIRREEKRARADAVQGVPLFVVNGLVPLSGAQDPATFVAAFGAAAERGRAPAPGEGEACGIEPGSRKC
ncbi:MAG: DsbA family oxidoreductase [Singulisphaera sp.]